MERYYIYAVSVISDD